MAVYGEYEGRGHGLVQVVISYELKKKKKTQFVKHTPKIAQTLKSSESKHTVLVWTLGAALCFHDILTA